jgi:hypothetical protein
MASLETKVVIGTKEGTCNGKLTAVRTGSSPLSPVLMVDGERYAPGDVPRGWRIYATPETDRELANQAAALGYPIEGAVDDEAGAPLEYLVRKVRRFPNGIRFVTIPKEYAAALSLRPGDVVKLYVDGVDLRIRRQNS